MNIILNGIDHPCADGTSLSMLLNDLGLQAKPVVVEHNEQAIFPRDYGQIVLQDGDRLEIIMLAAGG